MAQETLSQLLRQGGFRSASDAAYWLMPAALAIRDLHRKGVAHLHLSPDTLLFTPEGYVPEKVAGGYVTPAYAAPELLRQEGGDARSDIFSFCRILQDTAALLPPEEAEALGSIALGGLAEVPENRYPAIDEIIYRLEVMAGPRAAAIKQPSQPRRASKKGWIVAAACAVGLGLLYGLYEVHHALAVSAVSAALEAEDFQKASQESDAYWFMDAYEPRLRAYLDAGVLMEEGRYDEAYEAFTALDGYFDAANYAVESLYRKAAGLEADQDFEEAAAVYARITGYRDSREKAEAMLFAAAEAYLDEGEYEKALEAFLGLEQAGVDGAQAKVEEAQSKFWESREQQAYQLLQAGDFRGAGMIFAALQDEGYEPATEGLITTTYQMGEEQKNQGDLMSALHTLELLTGYAEADALIAEVKAGIYQWGVSAYQAYNYQEAADYFAELGDYEMASGYSFLCGIHLGHIPENTVDWQADLAPLLGFEDVNAILMSGAPYTLDFLLGAWVSGSDYMTFERNTDGSTHCSWNLPGEYDWGDYYAIEDGVFYLGLYADPNDIREQYYIEVVDQNTIIVFCYEDYTVYTLYRN